MEADHPKAGKQLGEYLALLSQRDATGRPFIIVGGQAVNFWAALYLPREPRLEQFLPLTSKDLDLIGTKADAARTAQAIGWHDSPPAVGGGPVQAILSSEPGGKGLTVEFLSEIKGVSHETVVEYARENILRSPGTAQSLAIRVLDPVLLLAGKLRNALEIDQDKPEKPRQDLKHVGMLGFCVPRFLEEIHLHSTDQRLRRDVSTKYVTGVPQKHVFWASVRGPISRCTPLGKIGAAFHSSDVVG